MKRIQTLVLLSMVAVLVGFLAPSAPAADNGDLAQGSWVEKSYSIDGTWKLVQRGSGTFIVLSDDFSTKKAPDLKIFLSTKSLDALNNKNAASGSLLIAPLRSHKGGQEYALPTGTNWRDYKTVLVHCEKYSKLWAAADLMAV